MDCKSWPWRKNFYTIVRRTKWSQSCTSSDWNWPNGWGQTWTHRGEKSGMRKGKFSWTGWNLKVNCFSTKFCWNWRTRGHLGSLLRGQGPKRLQRFQRLMKKWTRKRWIVFCDKRKSWTNPSDIFNFVCLFHNNLNFCQVGLKDLVLGRQSSPDMKNKDVIALGTFTTVSAWSRSQFKSGDGTFKITVKTFYQV